MSVDEVGRTADVGFQIGVRRSFPGTAEEAWERILSQAGLHSLLGGTGPIDPEPETTFRFRNGTTGEFRIVRPGDVMRLRWQPAGWARPSTLQVRVVPRAKGLCAISIHQEHLADAKMRARMRDHWVRVLSELGCAKR